MRKRFRKDPRRMARRAKRERQGKEPMRRVK